MCDLDPCPQLNLRVIENNTITGGQNVQRQEIIFSFPSCVCALLFVQLQQNNDFGFNHARAQTDTPGPEHFHLFSHKHLNLEQAICHNYSNETKTCVLQLASPVVDKGTVQQLKKCYGGERKQQSVMAEMRDAVVEKALTGLRAQTVTCQFDRNNDQHDNNYAVVQYRDVCDIDAMAQCQKQSLFVLHQGQTASHRPLIAATAE
ncbi:hypothetical protein F2P81_007203 [Scophthalmus maximus]|uniref:Uncharacterized protein n=1 Tax=Scophthalmus maximus TaxID=52904 RepID=A0A6A4T806_SCOMX|nr:hypothetical protein F2P81_007203 [Scophthalmus maximus]